MMKREYIYVNVGAVLFHYHEINYVAGCYKKRGFKRTKAKLFLSRLSFFL